jgi:flagellar protein FlgJ
MAIIPPSTPVITDFSQFAALRAAADRHDPKALKAAAQQFEAIFTQMLLKTARQSEMGDDLTGQQGDFYKDLFDQQMALQLSSGKGLGLADMLVQQLTKSGHGPGGVAALQAERKLPGSIPPGAAGSAIAAPAATPAGGTVSANDIDNPAWRPQSHEEFVAAIRPYAEKAAAELGVPPRALIAQAALETGWGQKIGRQADGGNGFNLFNIKAGGRWSGDSAMRDTREFEGGSWSTERAQFRSYPSIGAAFADYVSFLKGNPRYAEALNTGDIRGFAEGLQNGGYATDPQYAQKLLQVASSAEMSSAIGANQFLNA